MYEFHNKQTVGLSYISINTAVLSERILVHITVGITERFQFFRVGEDGEWNIIDGILTPSNATNYKVTGLHPYTVYSFRVVAVNAMGASAPSKESYYMVTLREGKINVIVCYLF